MRFSVSTLHCARDNYEVMNAYGQVPQEQPKEAAAFAQALPPQHFQQDTMAPASSWNTGFFRRLPWLAFLSIALAIIIAMLMVVIVVHSNNRPADWTVQPAVLLAIASTVANILIRFALSEGATVAWWVKSLKPNTQVNDLHRYWSFATSFKDALLSGKAFNLVALAGILVTITPINGPLLQRASSVTTAVSTKGVSLTVPIAKEYPFGFTGTITGRTHSPSFVTSNFSAVVRNLANGVSVNVTSSGCGGHCSGKLQAAGYDIECVNSLQSFNLSEAGAILPDGSVNTAITNGTYVFSTNFTYDEGALAPGGSGFPLNFTALYKAGKACDGDLNLTQCTLRPAIMEYNVVLNNDTISLDPGFSYQDDRVVEYTSPQYNTAQGPTTHGGMMLALNGLFSSSGHLRFTGAVGYELVTTGAAAIDYSTSVLDNIYSCPIAWGNPSHDMLGTARTLAFRTALAAANSSNATDTQTIDAVQEDVLVVYVSHYLYLGLALFFTLLSTVAVMPIFIGWWRLGRSVSLSPIEVAKAFDAPALGSSDSNATATYLLKEVGDRHLQYGAVNSRLFAMGAGADGTEKLVMAEPGAVRVPTDGHRYTG